MRHPPPAHNPHFKPMLRLVIAPPLDIGPLDHIPVGEPEDKSQDRGAPNAVMPSIRFPYTELVNRRYLELAIPVRIL